VPHGFAVSEPWVFRPLGIRLDTDAPQGASSVACPPWRGASSSRLARHLFGRAPRDSGIRSYVEPPRRTHLRRASLRRPFRESPNDSLDTSIPPLQAGSDSAYTGCTQDNLSVSVTTNNQLSSTGFSYDLAGNMTGDNTYTYGYNAESEIKSAAGVNYTYDGDGNRLEKSNGKLYWYGAGTEILDESDLSGNFTNEYVFFGGRRIAIRNVSSGTIDYYEEDMLGSSRTMVQAGQTSVCFDADFLPFGYEKDVTTTCTQNYKFEGKERDTETSNDDFGARYYTFRLGRWLSADWSSVPAPVPYANLTNPQTLNLYAMVSDNPESFADLDGHDRIPSTTGGCTITPGGAEGCKSTANVNVPETTGEGSGTQKTGTGTQPSTTQQAVQPTQQNQPSPQRGLTVGVGLAGNADVGVVKAGAETNATGVVTASVSSSGKPSVGVAASGAAVAYAGDHVAAAPKQETEPLVGGAYVGGGVTFVVANTANSNGLKGPFQTISGNVGGGQGASVALSLDHTGTFVLQITVGPSLGISGWAVTTNTIVGCAGGSACQ
jgi:RHS repeat-associated protein